ncbi:MAG: trigger factor, partial [Lachnospiraceae bacterium]|nr:trigger factor [Lachnospiraceae bacterium]
GETAGSQESGTASGETKSEKELTDEAILELGNYKGLTLTAIKAGVTDEDLDAELEILKGQYPAEVTGRAARLGDVANIDYVGTKDGEAFSGGTAEGFDLALGSGTFIDGFEDGVVGMNVGEEKDLNLTFPENYKSADLAGQEVVFHVTLNAIKNAEETAIDDALAKRAMDDENATLDQLRSQVYGGLENQAESNFFNEAGSELLNQAIENSKVTCDPDAVDDMYDQLVTTYTAYAGQYGMELEEFLSMFLQTDKAGLRATAENLVKQEMVLNAIIEAEGIKATDEEKDKLAQMNYFADAEEMVSTYGEESANRLFQMGAAYYYLIDNAVQGAPAGAGETVEGHTESQAAETTAP